VIIVISIIWDVYKEQTEKKSIPDRESSEPSNLQKAKDEKSDDSTDLSK